MSEPAADVRRGQRSITRRALFAATGIVGFAAVGSSVDLPFFSTSGAGDDTLGCLGLDQSAKDRRLVVSNWPDYIDPPEDPASSIKEFEQRTGVSVDYTPDVSDNSRFFEQVRSQLSECRTVKRDMFMLTDWMAARMIGLGWIQPLTASQVPNLHANLIDPLRGRGWDPQLRYHAPWQSGLTGIAYNAALVKEIGSFEELLTLDDLKGKVTLLSEMRDTMGFMLRLVGADPREFTDDDWANAADRLKAVVSSGHVSAFTGNEYVDHLSAGDIVACLAWSGDVIQAQFDNPDIKFVAPEEGLALWSDNMLIPNLATHQLNAEAWIDYFYQPDVAAKLAAWVNYICPVKGAREAMERVDPSLVDNSLIFPDDEMLKAAFDFMTLTDWQTHVYEQEWTDITRRS